MWGLVVNEFQKLHHRKKILITVIVMAILVALTSFGQYKENKNERMYNSISSQIKNIKSDLNEAKNKLKDEKNKEVKKEYNDQIQSDSQQITTLESQLKIEKDDKNWKKTLKESLTRLNKQKQQIEQSASKDNWSLQSLEESIAQTKYMMKNNIKPIPQYTTKAYGLFSSVNSNLSMMLIFIIIAIISADIVSAEYTPPTMKVLLTKPVPRYKVLLSKFIAAVLTGIGVVVFTEIVGFIIGGCIFGFNDAMQPMYIAKRYTTVISQATNWKSQLVPIVGSGHIIAMWQFCINQMLLNILYMTAATSVCFMLSAVCKSSMISTSVSIVAYIAMNIIVRLPYVSHISHIFFSTYADAVSLQTGELCNNYGNSSINLTMGIIVLVLWCVVPYLIANYVFRRRDMLI